jgi:5-methylthioadenosine/S-adenosylhomocysteine deaminase
MSDARQYTHFWKRRAVLKAGSGGIAGAMLASLLGRPAFAQDQAPNALPARETLLIQNAHIVTMDPTLGQLTGDVRIENGNIAAVGKNLQPNGARMLDGRGMIVIPGLIDTHWHMWNSIARSFVPMPSGEPFAEAMKKINTGYAPEYAYLGVRLAAAEALNSGITTVHNWAHNIAGPAFADAEWRALQDSGLGGRFSYGYPQSLTADKTMDFSDAQRMRSVVEAHPDWHYGLCFRGPERTEDAVWTREWAFGREQGLPMTTHIAVTRELQKQRAIQALAKRDLLGPDVQLVHATHADADDCRAIVAQGSPVSLSPFTEMRVGYGLPPVMRLHEAGVEISLSVDNTPLAGNADFFSIMRLTLNLATGMSENQLALTPERVLHWATLGGARDLGIADRVGSITVGKRADLVMLDARRLGTVPLTDALAIVTQSVQPADVDTVIAGGRMMKHAGRLVGLDDRKLVADVERGWAELRAKGGF